MWPSRPLARFFEVSADYLLELSPEKTSEPPTELRGLDEIKASQGLTCDGLPLSEDEVDLVAMYRGSSRRPIERRSSTSSTSSTSATSRRKKNLFTRHISTGARTKKAAPLGAVRPRRNRLIFLPCHD